MKTQTLKSGKREWVCEPQLDKRKTNHEWTGLGPQLQVETLTDGSKVFNVTISAKTIFCVDERHALQLIEDLNQAAIKAV